MLAQSAVMRYVRLPIRDGVTFRYRDHIGSNSSKIISRPNSLRPMRALTATWAIWCNGNTPNLGWNRGGVRSTAVRSPKRCKIGLRLLLRTNRKSHTCFRLALILLTLDDLERPKRPVRRNKQKFRSPPETFQRR